VSAAPTLIAPERDAPARRVRPRSVRRQRLVVVVAEHAGLVALALAFLAPLVFIALTSLMTDRQALSPDLWPHPFRLRNYADVFSKVPLLRYAANTFIYATLATIGVIVSSVPVAYALSRLRWRGRDAVYLLVVASMMLPSISPVILFSVVLGVIFALQYFTQAYVAANVAAGQASQAGSTSTLELGYPEGSTLFYPVLLYYHGFRFFNMGYASAMAVLLLVVAFAVTSLIIRGSRRRVHYGTTR